MMDARPPQTANVTHYVRTLENMYAPTEIEENPTTSYTPHPPSANIPIVSRAALVLQQPFQQLAAYAARAYLPCMPNRLSHLLEDHQKCLLTQNVNHAKSVEDARSVIGSLLNTRPLGGRRKFAEIEQIDGECLGRAAHEWNKRIPNFLNIVELATKRPDLFDFGLNSNIPIPKPEKFAFALPAFGFSTESIPIEDTEAASPSRLLTHLTDVFCSTMMRTAATLIHASEYDKSMGWQWFTQEEAKGLLQHRNAQLPSMNRELASRGGSLPTTWGAFVWARRPLDRGGDTYDSRLSGSSTQLSRGMQVKIPGSEDVIQSREARWDYVDPAMVAFVVPPTFGMTEMDFINMCQSQEFTDGARGEHEFTLSDAVWATIHDMCGELCIKHFAITTYTSIAFGAFTSSFESVFISPPMSTHEPDNWNPSFGPIMPPFQPHRKLPVDDPLVGESRPNALQQLTYWMRTSMGDCQEGWIIPSEVDGSAGWSGAMMALPQQGQMTDASAYQTVEPSSTKEWIWHFTKTEPSSIAAHRDAHDAVKNIFAGEGITSRVTLEDLDNGVPSGFVGGAVGNSVLMEARHAQVSQRLDQIALSGGDGIEAVPVIARTNELGQPLSRLWFESEDGVMEMSGDAFAWVRPGVEHEGVVDHMASRLVVVDEDQVSVDGIEEVEEEGSQRKVVADEDNMPFTETESVDVFGQRNNSSRPVRRSVAPVRLTPTFAATTPRKRGRLTSSVPMPEPSLNRMRMAGGADDENGLAAGGPTVTPTARRRLVQTPKASRSRKV
ncbi:hypothetical protein FRB95_011630 [Tulasnella sp. JGI-2019a]|nr:hypothetical protein FRB95_011630 [Tulasnella sp. JGI-2019a]